MNATLISHVNTDIVSREELSALPAPVPVSGRHRPVAHIELVDTLSRALSDYGIQVEAEQYALRRDDAALFGVLDLSWKNGYAAFAQEGRAALGFRHANDCTMSIQIVAGLRVFVCDNLALRGDFIALRRKHTIGLSLRRELGIAVEKLANHYQALTGEIELLRQWEIGVNDAKALIHDVFVKGYMPIRFLPQVSREFFEGYAQRSGWNAWALHNAFTEVAKQMPLTTRLRATQEIGRFFGLSSNRPQLPPAAFADVASAAEQSAPNTTQEAA